MDPASIGGLEQKLALKHALQTGAVSVRLMVPWNQVAPGGESKPASFNPRNPGDPTYRWADTDDQVRSAIALGLQPIIYIQGAPTWAQSGSAQRWSDGAVRPSPTALADFATAAAKRYGGKFGGFPRVRYWQVWNEPNLSIQLMPQHEDGKAVSPDWYRAMVNAMAKAVHAVHRDNVVIAGGLAPFGGDVNDDPGGKVPDQERIHPLEFMRQMLCMSEGARPNPTCTAVSDFDVWAHHPYTYGGPTHKALHPDDVSLEVVP